MDIKITVDDRQVKELLEKLQKRAGDLSPVMRTISEMMRGAVEDNFEAEGRPKWKKSRRAIEQGGKTLQDTGRLAASITKRATSTSAEVGTNVVYAAIHHFGGRTKPRIIKPRNKKALYWPGARHPVKSVKHPGSKMPARPFMHLTDSDVADIIEVIGKHLTK